METTTPLFITHLQNRFPQGADLHTPVLGSTERDRLMECLDSTFVSSVGPMTTAVEQRLASITGAESAIVTSNGTSALHLCLHALGVGSNDLVIVPTMTFVATANAVLYTGASCLFVDIEPERFGVDPVKLEQFLITECSPDPITKACIHTASGKQIKALILVHLFGVPALIDEIQSLCRTFNIELVEDAAESLGSFSNGRHTGTFARVSALSFNGNKIVTAGGGGAVLTSEPELARRIKHLSTTAKVPSDFNFYHDEMGFNYRMPNLNAALLLAQLDSFEGFLFKKRALYEEYQKLLATSPEGSLYIEPKGCRSNYWLINFILHSEFSSEHEAFISALNSKKIRVRPPWNLLHTLPYLSHCPRMEDLTVALNYSRRIISLPSSAHLIGETA